MPVAGAAEDDEQAGRTRTYDERLLLANPNTIGEMLRKRRLDICMTGVDKPRKRDFGGDGPKPSWLPFADGAA
jgi:hypothetical protein